MNLENLNLVELNAQEVEKVQGGDTDFAGFVNWLFGGNTGNSGSGVRPYCSITGHGPKKK